ncbi:MAG: DUF4838 domain-containing protein [Phycisphaerae bacterium]
MITKRNQYSRVAYLFATCVALVGTALTAGGASLTLADRGHTRYAIVIAPKASIAVQHAARELAADLRRISGATFSVTSKQPDGPAIYVGPGAMLRAAFPKLAIKDMPADGFFIQTSAGNLALAGKQGRGTLYAVYSFLEEHLGVRWYSPHDTVIPQQREVRIPALSEKQVPAFTYRDTNEYPALRHAQWDAHLKLNGVSVHDKAVLGGNNRLFNGAENFYDLVPPAKYFAKHPEYYSLINGKRSDQYYGGAAPTSQLSLVNPNVLRIVTAALLAQAKADPKLLVLGLSPNDADGNSQGAHSRASDAHYGAPSGTLLHFVNKVAAAVQQELPSRKIWVETLAYQYTEKPPIPGTIHAARNVLVCFAPVRMDYACPITAPQNHVTLKNLVGWDKVAPGHIQVWTYTTNFRNYLQPFPDWDELGADMELYREYGVSGMFCEGDYNSVGDMQMMRTWVMAHLMWNSKLNIWKLIREFSNGYYGPAGPYIYRYVRLLCRQMREPNMALGIDDSPSASYLTPALLKQSQMLFLKARVAVRADPAELNRVREAEMGIRYVELVRCVPAAKSTAAEKAAFRARLNRFVRDVRRFKITYIAEDHPIAGWISAMRSAAR